MRIKWNGTTKIGFQKTDEIKYKFVLNDEIKYKMMYTRHNECMIDK